MTVTQLILFFLAVWFLVGFITGIKYIRTEGDFRVSDIDVAILFGCCGFITLIAFFLDKNGETILFKKYKKDENST
jgi:hypothetical protein